MESVIERVLTNPTIITAIIIGASALLLVYILKLFRQDTVVHEQKQSKHEKSSFLHNEKKKETSSSSSSSHSAKSKKKVVENRWSGRTEKQNFSHPWLLTSLKGHNGTILDMDFSSNGKYLTSCGDDRSVFIWDTKDLTQKERKSLRVNIEFDYATLVKWSPDCKAFIINKFNENTVEVYKVDKKKDGWLQSTKALTFPKFHETDIIGMGIASNGKFIMTCSNQTDMAIWDLKGQKLAQLDTYLMNTTCAKISPCGKYIVASGFTPEAKVWEVSFNKTSEFQDVKPISELTLGGHSSGVYDVAFDVDSSHMATVSKDGTWNFFNTEVYQRLGVCARLITSGKYEQASNNALIALSPNAEVLAIATASNLALYSTFGGTLDYVIENIYAGNITAVLFDASGKYVLTAGDKHIRVFHNVTGYRCSIETAKQKLKEHQTSATKERLHKLIVDSEAFLEQIEKK